MPLAMTAHVVYSAIDPKRPATTSKKVIRDIIRGEIGYDGLIMSDDLSMKALAGSFADRTKASLAAGCDVVLHCNGELSEMKAVFAATPELAGKAKRRAKSALKRISHVPEPFDPVEGRARLDAALATIS
jgi:beta-N-acetylhexosaminidase